MIARVLLTGSLSLAALDAQTLVQRLDGDAAGDGFGQAVDVIGDVSGDGVDDFIVGAYQADPGGRANAGLARVYSGSDRSVLYSYEGDGAQHWFGIGVGGAGDVNGDAVPDFVIGAAQNPDAPVGPGYVRIYSGSDGSLIRQLDGTSNGDAFGWAVVGVGDLDADGCDDVLVTAYYDSTANGTRSGSANVYSGRTGVALFPPMLGDLTFGFLGRNAAALGDVDMDTVPDFAVSQVGSNVNGASSGAVRVYSGADGSTLYTVPGEASDDRLGQVAGLGGDATGDGVPDLAVGGRHSANGTHAGRVYLVNGATGAVVRSHDGSAAGDRLANVGRVGDVDGDGFADVACGADSSINGGAGYLRVYSGQTGALLAEISPGIAGDGFGYRPVAGGDMLGDGLPTLLVGAPSNAGSVSIYSYRDATPKDVALCDADGDGALDAAIANTISNNVSLRIGDGMGALGVPADIALDPADRDPCALASGELGGASGDDLAIACAASATVAIVVDPAGTPAVTSLAAGGMRPVAIAIGDLDGTGTDDVVVGREGAIVGGAGSGLAVSLGGAAFADLTIPGGHPTRCVDVALCDLDGDGDTDLAAVAQGAPSAEVLLFDGDGTGTLTYVGALALGSGELAGGLCCEDLDGDGDHDLLAGWSALLPTPSARLRVFTFTGAAPLDAADYTMNGDVATGGTLITDIACGDLDGTSFPDHAFDRDVVVVHGGSAAVASFYGLDAGAATYGSTAPIGTGMNPVGVAVGDLDGDGIDDVVVAAQSGGLTVTLGEAAVIASAFGTGCPGTGGLTPVLTALGMPALGNATFGMRLTDARASAPAVLMFSAQATVSALLPSSCTLYLGGAVSSLVQFTDASGIRAYMFGVPNDSGLAGLELFFQSAVFDPNGAFAGVVAFSNAVRVQAGR